MPNQWTLGLSQAGPTDEQMDKLCAAAEVGRSVSACAAEASLSQNTVRQWMRLGGPARQKLLNGEAVDNTQAIYASFLERFEQARAKGIQHLENVMSRRAEEGLGTWTEGAWKLERNHRDEFGRQPEVVQGGNAPTVIIIEGRPSRELPPETFVEGVVVARSDQDELPASGETTGVS